MKPTISLFAASAIVLAQSAAYAAPGTQSGPPASGSISPAHETGQPMVECEDFGDDSTPGKAADSRGGGSAFQEDSVSKAHYAGDQDVNSKNTASVSQYDVACAHQPE
jgi:hypothetical protein